MTEPTASSADLTASPAPAQDLSQRTLDGLSAASMTYFLGGPIDESHRYAMCLMRDALGASKVFFATWTQNGFIGRVLIGATAEATKRFERSQIPPFPCTAPLSDDGVVSIEVIHDLEANHHWLAELAGSDSVVLATGGQSELHPISVVGLGGLGQIDDDQRRSVQAFAYLLMGSVLGERLDTQRALASDRRTSSLEMLADEVDAERRRMSHEIHDGVLQNVTSIAHFLETLSVTVEDPSTKSTLERLRVEAQSAAITLRRLVTEFEPEQSPPTTLAAEMDELAARSSKLFGLSVNVEIDESVNDHPAAGTVLWVVRQALDNAIAHADASMVTVGVEQDADDLILRIEDDGNGFDTAAPWNPGVGLRSMHGRVLEYGGTLQINAEVGVGTRLMALFPHRITTTGGSGTTGLQPDQVNDLKQRIRSAALEIIDHDQRPTITSVALRAGVQRREVLARFSSVDEIVADAVSGQIAMIEERLAEWPPIDLAAPLDERLNELITRRFMMEQWGRPIRDATYLVDPTPRFDHQVIEAIQPELKAIEDPQAAHLGPMVAWLLRPRSIRAVVLSPGVDAEAAQATLQFIATALLTAPDQAAPDDGA